MEDPLEFQICALEHGILIVELVLGKVLSHCYCGIVPAAATLQQSACARSLLSQETMTREISVSSVIVQCF